MLNTPPGRDWLRPIESKAPPGRHSHSQHLLYAGRSGLSFLQGLMTVAIKAPANKLVESVSSRHSVSVQGPVHSGEVWQQKTTSHNHTCVMKNKACHKTSKQAKNNTSQSYMCDENKASSNLNISNFKHQISNLKSLNHIRSLNYLLWMSVHLKRQALVDSQPFTLKVKVPLFQTQRHRSKPSLSPARIKWKNRIKHHWLLTHLMRKKTSQTLTTFSFCDALGLHSMVVFEQPGHMLNKHASTLSFRHHISELIIRTHMHKLNKTIANIITTCMRSQINVLSSRMTCVVFAKWNACFVILINHSWFCLCQTQFIH